MRKLWMLPMLGLLACASAETKIVSSPDGSFLVIAKAYNESRAIEGAKDAATAYCRKQGKEVVIVDKGETQKTAFRQPQRAGRGATERDRQRKFDESGGPSPDSEISLVFKCR